MLKVDKHVLVPLMLVIILSAIFIIVSKTLTSVIVFIPGLIITYLVYLNTFYKRTVNPDRILSLYLLALGIQFLHFSEEYLTDFTIEIPKLLGQSPYPTDYWVIFNMVAYFVFIIGGIILFERIKEFMIIPLFFILTGVILNSIGHIMLSFYVGGYFPGLYTAIVYTVLGPVIMKRVLDESGVNLNEVT